MIDLLLQVPGGSRSGTGLRAPSQRPWWFVRSFVASTEGVAEEVRTRSFAAPALAGCAFVEGWCGLSYRPVRTLSRRFHRVQAACGARLMESPGFE
jgi:hypothetical protein